MIRKSRRVWIAIAIISLLPASAILGKAILYDQVWLYYSAQQKADELRLKYPDAAAEEKMANVYWHLYPDVQKSIYYGRNGHMGVYGPRAHYIIHGKTEGRIWPKS